MMKTCLRAMGTAAQVRGRAKRLDAGKVALAFEASRAAAHEEAASGTEGFQANKALENKKN